MSDQGLVRDASPGWLRSGVEASLEALGVEHIDLYQVHWPDPKVPFAETAGALQELVDAGKIRHVGVSNFDPEQIAEFATDAAGRDASAALSPVPPRHRARILPYCAAHDIGVLVYGPLAHGLLTGALDERTEFPPGDWRGDAPFFKGDELPPQSRGRAVSSSGSRGTTSGYRWADSRSPGRLPTRPSTSRSSAPAAARHIEDAVAAARTHLSDADLERIDEIMMRRGADVRALARDDARLKSRAG